MTGLTRDQGPAAGSQLARRSETAAHALNHREAIRVAERSCCCTAPPAYRVLLIRRDGASIHPVDLLLCGHHYRASAVSLARLGAMVFDHDGFLMPPGESRFS